MCLQAVKKQEKRNKFELENVEKELAEKTEVLKKGSVMCVKRHLFDKYILPGNLITT